MTCVEAGRRKKCRPWIALDKALMVFLAHLGHGLAFAILDDLFSEPEPTCWCVV